jgi:hypothetical protein
MTTAEQLTSLRAALDAADARAAALAASCPPGAWTRRPPDGGWSPSECLQHIVLSVDAMLTRMDAAIADGHARGLRGDGPFRPGLLGRLLIWSLEPPYRRLRSKTPAAFVPATADTPDHDVAALREALDRLTIVSPFEARASYNLYAAFAILPVHARRHLWQAEQALARR